VGYTRRAKPGGGSAQRRDEEPFSSATELVPKASRKRASFATNRPKREIRWREIGLRGIVFYVDEKGVLLKEGTRGTKAVSPRTGQGGETCSVCM